MKFQLPPMENSTDFEDLICDLFNLQNATESFKKFGKQGHKQKGIDIFSVELDTVIQCKKKDLSRKQSLLKKELLNDIEEDVKKIMINDLRIKFNRLYIVTTFENHPDFDEYCEDIKEMYDCKFDITFWGWNTIQDLVLNNEKKKKKYYPQFRWTTANEEESFLRNQALKNRIRRDFSDWLNYPLKNRKRKSKMLIRKFNDKSYPYRNEPNDFSEYDWYNAGLYQTYDKGLEFILSTHEIISLPDNKWRFIKPGEKTNGNNFIVSKIGKINYSEIIDYDIDGNEYDLHPHFYCKFLYSGTPYEEIYYVDKDKIFNRFEIINQENG